MVAALAIGTAATGRGSDELYVLGAVTIALKALLFPLGIRFVLRNLEVRPAGPVGRRRADRDPARGRAVAFVVHGAVARSTSARRARAAAVGALPVAVGGVLVAFLLMVVRPYAPSQLLGFLVLENAVSVASLVIAPGLPIILALLLLFDVLVGVLVFVVLVQYLAMERSAVTTDVLSRLRG